MLARGLVAMMESRIRGYIRYHSCFSACFHIRFFLLGLWTVSRVFQSPHMRLSPLLPFQWERAS